MIVGEKEGIQAVARLIGNDVKKLSDTDFFPIAMGIVLGVLFGKLNISFGGGVSFSGTDGRNFDDGSFLECYWKDRTYYLVNVRTG